MHSRNQYLKRLQERYFRLNQRRRSLLSWTNKLRLYKNFFCPVMKLVKKERIGGKVKRKYDVPKTPYQRLIGSEHNLIRISE